MTKPPISIRAISAVVGVAMLAACATPPPPPPPPPAPPPPPPVVEAIPFRPVPPPQAAYQMEIPRKDAAGTRQTVNAGIGQDEAVWHFRSGWNVAALNCMRPEHEPILTGYGQMLRAEDRVLSDANNAIERRFQERARDELANDGLPTTRNDVRRAAIRLREAHATSTYNYFATPPARRNFCNAALAVANEYLAARPADFPGFAVSGLQRFESAFEDFFSTYERYEVESTEWDARYGSRYGASQPGWVALYGTPDQQRAMGVLVRQVSADETLVVPDSETGTPIPVIPVDETNASTPVVQPIPMNTTDQ